MNFRSFAIGISAGLVLSVIAAVIYFQANRAEHNIVSSPDWLRNKDSVSEVNTGSNYYFAIKKANYKFMPDKSYLNPIDSDLATRMSIRFHDLIKTAGMEKTASYCVDLPSAQVLGYLAAVGSANYSNLKYIRFYIGAYPSRMDDDHLENKLSVFVVGVDGRGNELYKNDDPNQQIQDFGSLCPTHCPSLTDAKSIFNLAKLPRTN